MEYEIWDRPMKKRKEIVLASPLETFDDFFRAIEKAVREARRQLGKK